MWYKDGTIKLECEGTKVIFEYNLCFYNHWSALVLKSILLPFLILVFLLTIDDQNVITTTSKHIIEYGKNFTITPRSDYNTKFCEVFSPSGKILRYSDQESKIVTQTFRYCVCLIMIYMNIIGIIVLRQLFIEINLKNYFLIL